MSSPVSSSRKVALDPESFLKHLECPVELTPLTSAVTLSPCMHKINEGIALKIFGPMNEEECKQKEACPVYRKVVKAYYADHVFRSVVQTIFNSASAPEVALPAISASVEAEKKLNLSEIPAFGKPAKFIVTSKVRSCQ